MGSHVCGEEPTARGPDFCQVLFGLPDQVGSHAPHVGVAHGDRARLADKTGRSRSQLESPIASGHLGPMVQTYVGSQVEENWVALFPTIELFRRVAREVGAALGYTYAKQLDDEVAACLNAVRRFLL